MSMPCSSSSIGYTLALTHSLARSHKALRQYYKWYFNTTQDKCDGSLLNANTHTHTHTCQMQKQKQQQQQRRTNKIVV